MRKRLSALFGVAAILGMLMFAGCGGSGGGAAGSGGANAGPDQNVSTGYVVTLDGSGSSGAGSGLTYSWSFVSMPASSTATLNGATTVGPTFTADKDGSYVIQLIVNDGTTDSAPDTVTITAATGNTVPVANAGIDQDVYTGATVTLSGSASSDADGDTLTYAWSFTSKPGTSAAALTGATTVTPAFTADADGSYVIQLVVNDGAVSSAVDTITITANPAPTTGILDTAFGTNGITVSSFDLSYDKAAAMAVQADGKIVAAGTVWEVYNSSIAVARYNADGSLDSGFGTNGKVITPVGSADSATGDVAIQADGKIVVAGSSYVGSNLAIAVVRYNADGSLDTTFDGDGIVTTSFIAGVTSEGASSVVIQADGKIVVGGSTTWVGSSDYDFALARYTTTGALDTSFGSGGTVTTAINAGMYYDGIKALALQTDGKIVAAGIGRGKYMVVARYTTSGDPDTTFSGDGYRESSFGADYSSSGYDVVIQPDGMIVVAGTTRVMSTSMQSFALIRYTTSGGVDSTFGSGGLVSTSIGTSGQDYAFSVALQADGKIVVAGDTLNSGTHVALVRYLANGSLDAGFGTGGKTVSFAGSAGDVAVLADGNIMVAGYGYHSADTSAHFAVARFIP